MWWSLYSDSSEIEISYKEIRDSVNRYIAIYTFVDKLILYKTSLQKFQLNESIISILKTDNNLISMLNILRQTKLLNADDYIQGNEKLQKKFISILNTVVTKASDLKQCVIDYINQELQLVNHQYSIFLSNILTHLKCIKLKLSNILSEYPDRVISTELIFIVTNIREYYNIAIGDKLGIISELALTKCDTYRTLDPILGLIDTIIQYTQTLEIRPLPSTNLSETVETFEAHRYETRLERKFLLRTLKQYLELVQILRK